MIDVKHEVYAVLEKYGLDEETKFDTPMRVQRMLWEMWGGLHKPMPTLKAYEAGAQEGMTVTVRNMEFCSTCKHHLLPFFGKVTITYVVGEKVLGLSKFSRLVQWVASRPTIQEEMTLQIKTILEEVLGVPVVVTVEAKHTCVFARGIKDSCADTVTTL